MPPRAHLQLTYLPSLFKWEDRAGEVLFQVWPLEHSAGSPDEVRPVEGKAAIGKTFDTGEYLLEFREVRYWVGMYVKHDPGHPIVLTSLWVGFGGVVMTFFGRLRRKGGTAGTTATTATTGTAGTTATDEGET